MSKHAVPTTALALFALTACATTSATDPPRGAVGPSGAPLAPTGAEAAAPAAPVAEEPAAAAIPAGTLRDPGLADGELAAPAAPPRQGDDGAEVDADAAAQVLRVGGVPIRGSLVLRPLVRASSGDSDFDLYAYLSVDAGDEATDDWTGRFTGRLAVNGSGDDVFDGIQDSWDGALHGRIYDAWAQWSGSEDLPLVRLGRQSDWETPELVIYDGVRLESRELGERAVTVGAYGGVAVHHYESSPEGDLLGGVYVEGRPWEDGRVRLDLLSAEDEIGDTDLDGTLLGASVWHTLHERLRLRGAYSHLHGDPRDVDLGATWFDLEEDLVVSLDYYELFEEQRANPLEFDTFSTTLFELFPYYRVGLLGSKGLTEEVRVEGGFELRNVDDSDDEGTFNRDVDRYWATTSLADLLAEDLTLSVTGDWWDGDAQETWSLGADLAYDLDEATRGSIGTYYALYEFDELLVAEREDVRTYYAAFERDLTRSLELAVRYAYEDGDTEDFHTLRVKLSWRF